MVEKYGFVYIWRDRKHKRYYIGCHWGTEDDGYICSSSWMKQAYKIRPHDFKRRILKTNISRQEILMEEFKWLSLIKPEELKIKYYNLNIHHFGHWTNDQDKLLTISEKISKKNKENPDWGSWSKGKKASEETRKKMSESKKGKKRSEETKQKISESNKGRNLSEETKQKIREASKKQWANTVFKQWMVETNTGENNPNYGKITSEDTRQKLSIALTGREFSEETIQKIRETKMNKNGSRIIILPLDIPV